MGWWTVNDAWVGPELVWGDAPADALDDALHKIVREFKRAEGRKPTKAEIRHGLEFALEAYDD